MKTTILSSGILFVLLALAGHWMPAIGAILPPCCQVPDIIEEIASRPPAERPEEFFQWLEERYDRFGEEVWRADVAALTGACSQGCPPQYLMALNRITEHVATTEIYDLASIAAAIAIIESAETRDENRQHVDGDSLVPRSPPYLLFAGDFLGKLREWEGAAGDLVDWTRTELAAQSDSELGTLDSVLAGACTQETDRCPAYTIARLTIEDILEEREKAEENRLREVQNSQLEQNSYIDRKIAILIGISTIASGLIGVIIGNIIASVLHSRRSRKNDDSIIQIARENSRLVSDVNQLLKSQKSHRFRSRPLH